MAAERNTKIRFQFDSTVADLEPMLFCVRRACMGDAVYQVCHPDYWLRLDSDAQVGPFPISIEWVPWRHITFHRALDGDRTMHGYRQIIGLIKLSTGSWMTFNWREGPDVKLSVWVSTDRDLLLRVLKESYYNKYIEETNPIPSNFWQLEDYYSTAQAMGNQALTLELERYLEDAREKEAEVERSFQARQKFVQQLREQADSSMSDSIFEEWGGAERVAPAPPPPLIRSCEEECGRMISVSGEDRCTRCMNNMILLRDIQAILESGADTDSMERSINEHVTLHMNTHRRLDNRERILCPTPIRVQPRRRVMDPEADLSD